MSFELQGWMNRILGSVTLQRMKENNGRRWKISMDANGNTACQKKPVTAVYITPALLSRCWLSLLRGFIPVLDYARQPDVQTVITPNGLYAGNTLALWAWSLNRRVVGITALADPAGKPDPKRMPIRGTGAKWKKLYPTLTMQRRERDQSVHHAALQRAVTRSFAIDKMKHNHPRTPLSRRKRRCWAQPAAPERISTWRRV